MINGCFKLLYVGRVQYRQSAKELSDGLIVAVNDDLFVAPLKGPSRPVNGLAQHMAVLAALGGVTWAEPFGTDTPCARNRQVLPDVVLKGSAYSPEKIAGSDCVREVRDDARQIDFGPGCSTSGTLERTSSAAPGKGA